MTNKEKANEISIMNAIGKTFSYHDSYDATSYYFKVDDIKIDKNGYISLWANHPNCLSNHFTIDIDRDILYQLLADGKYYENGENNHRPFTRIYRLK